MTRWFETITIDEPFPLGAHTFTEAEIIRFGTRHAELRADFFNLTNTPHWNNPSGSLESNNFGRVTSSFGERVILKDFSTRILRGDRVAWSVWLRIT